MASGDAQRGGRRLRRLAGLATAAALALVVAVLVALHLPPVQRALMRWATAEVEARTGLRLAAEAFRLRPLGLHLRLERPSLAVAGAPPFVTAESLTVEAAPVSLLRGPLRLRRVDLVGPRLDGRRPLPQPSAAAAGADGQAPPELSVESLRVTRGSLAGFDLPLPGDQPPGSLTVEGLEVDGRLVAGQLGLAARLDRLVWAPTGQPPFEAVVEADVEGPLTGPLRLDRLAVDGPALAARAAGQIGLAPDQPMTVDLELEVDAAALLGVASMGEPVRLSGRLDLRRMEGELELEAPNLPGELARPLLSAELFEQTALAGSRLALSGSLTLAEGRVEGAAEAGWSRGEQVLAAVNVAASGELAAAELPIEVDLTLLPRVTGERRVEARLLMPREAPAEVRVEQGRLRLAVPDLKADLARLAAIWPAWVVEPPGDLAAGRLRGAGSFAGPLSGLEASFEGEWTPAPGASVRLTAEGGLAPRRAQLRVAAAAVPLARFLEGGSGTLAGTARLTLTGDRLEGEVELAGEGLGHGELVADRLRLAASLDGTGARVRELMVERDQQALRIAGQVELGSPAAAELDLALTGGWGPLTAAEGRLQLAGGVLRLELPRIDLGGEAARASITVPLAALAGLPRAEALTTLPLGAADGPVEISWDQPAIDWASVPAAGVPEPEAAGSRWWLGSRGRLTLDPSAPGAAAGEIELLDLALEQDGRSVVASAPLRLTLASGELELAPAALTVDGHPAELRGAARLATDWTPGESLDGLVEEARVAASAPAAAPLESAQLEVWLRSGRLELAGRAPLRAGGEARLQAAAALDSLVAGKGSVEVSWQLPATDWTPWLADPAAEDRVLTRLVAGVDGRLDLDLEAPARTSGELRLPTLEVDLGDQLLRAREPIELRLADGRLEIVSARLFASGAPLALSGRVDLETRWAPGAPLAEVVRELSLSGGGVLPAALLNPFLAGGAGEGALLAEFELSGPRQALRGDLRLTGEGAGFFFVLPYALEVAAPDLAVRLADGAASFTGTARVNEGLLGFTGEADPESGLRLRAELESVRALLDYGLLILLDGDLRLALAADGDGLLSGTVTVDSGQLTRPIRLESLLLDQLLPADLLGTELDPLEAIALDLSLATRQGVRVRNNLADLKVGWEPISVRGNLVRPIIEGRLGVEPGGLVYAYGQTLRLDSAEVIYEGLPEEVPTLELQATSSLEDPSVGRLAGNDPFSVERPDPRAGPVGAGAAAGDSGRAGVALTAGLASLLGEQFNTSVGQALGGTRISVRPLLIFGETDPGARLTAASELSPFVTLAASVDLRNAERQTYLLDLHDEQAAARLSAQLFSNDFGNEGATLQQRLELGGAKRAAGPRLRRLTLDPVPGVRRRALKRAIGYRRGDRLPAGGAFEASVALGELLRERGYPDARVRVAEEPVEGRSGVALNVSIKSGPRVRFRFSGGELPRGLRRVVAELYRGDFYEPTALEEMRVEAVRAWRSRGYLDPEVEVRRELVSAGPPEERLITVESRPGERVTLAPPRFTGLPQSEAAGLSALYPDVLRRAELAVGLAAAERRALQGLAALGWPEAAIVGRTLSPDRRQLTVEVEPGERLRVARLEFAGAGGARTEVGNAGGVAAGDPLRADQISQAALQVERELRDAGFLDAEVSVRVEPADGGQPTDRLVVFTIDRGSIYKLAATEFSGLRSTRPAWARRTARLAEGEALAPGKLQQARRRLYETGLFSAVGSAVEGTEDGALVRFAAQEKPRYQLGYGLRWESEEGGSVVVDLLDRNVLGRGIDFGLRTLWSQDIQRLRLSGSIPGVLGPKSRLDLFGLAGKEEELVDDGEVLIETRTTEGTVQIGWQLGRRTTGRIYGRYRDVHFTENFLVEDPFFGPLEPFAVRVRLPFLGVQYIFDDRDDPVTPWRGRFASVDLSFSDESLGGDINYARLFGQINSFRPAGWLARRRLTWAQSVRLGRVEAFSGQELLGDLLLRAGGEYSVRGYRRESLGPPELIGRVLPSIRENSLFVLNEELRFELWDLVSGLIFFDAGNVWIDDDIDLDLFTSLGLGLRAGTPVGLLRLDVAWPLDRRPDVDPGVKVYFGLGNVF